MEKKYNCSIHGNIYLPYNIVKIIDTKEFQRLRNIKQLGFCSYVYSTANHNRFEHCIGTFYITQKITKRLQTLYPDKQYYIPILNKHITLDEHYANCINIAGLLHDVGHGPYGHFFDDIILKDYYGPNKTHEERSCNIMKIILNKIFPDIFSESDIKFIASIIHPSENDIGSLYQIVSNYLNGLDSDKFDYLTRDSYYTCGTKYFNYERIINSMLIVDDNICYYEACLEDLNSIYNMRKSMHRKVYGHPTNKLIEKMYYDIYTHLKRDFNFEDYLDDMTKFIELNDNTMFNYISLTKLSKLSISQNSIPHFSQQYNKIIINETDKDEPKIIFIEKEYKYDPDKVYELYERFLSRDKYKKINTYTHDEITNELLAKEYPYIVRTIKHQLSNNVFIYNKNNTLSKKKLDNEYYLENKETLYITYRV